MNPRTLCTSLVPVPYARLILTVGGLCTSLIIHTLFNKEDRTVWAGKILGPNGNHDRSVELLTSSDPGIEGSYTLACECNLRYILHTCMYVYVCVGLYLKQMLHVLK